MTEDEFVAAVTEGQPRAPPLLRLRRPAQPRAPPRCSLEGGAPRCSTSTTVLAPPRPAGAAARRPRTGRLRRRPPAGCGQRRARRAASPNGPATCCRPSATSCSSATRSRRPRPGSAWAGWGSTGWWTARRPGRGASGPARPRRGQLPARRPAPGRAADRWHAPPAGRRAQPGGDGGRHAARRPAATPRRPDRAMRRYVNPTSTTSTYCRSGRRGVAAGRRAACLPPSPPGCARRPAGGVCQRSAARPGAGRRAGS